MLPLRMLVAFMRSSLSDGPVLSADLHAELGVGREDFLGAVVRKVNRQLEILARSLAVEDLARRRTWDGARRRRRRSRPPGPAPARTVRRRGAAGRWPRVAPRRGPPMNRRGPVRASPAFRRLRTPRRASVSAISSAGNLVDEAGRRVGHQRALVAPVVGVAQQQALAGPGHGHVAEPALLLEVLVRSRWTWRGGTGSPPGRRGRRPRTRAPWRSGSSSGSRRAVRRRRPHPRPGRSGRGSSRSVASLGSPRRVRRRRRSARARSPSARRPARRRPCRGRPRSPRRRRRCSIRSATGSSSARRGQVGHEVQEAAQHLGRARGQQLLLQRVAAASIRGSPVARASVVDQPQGRVRRCRAAEC